MGQRITISEAEKNRIKGLYEQAKPQTKVKPRGEKIPTIQIKVGPEMCDLTMMEKTPKGASFFGKKRGSEDFYKVTLVCNEPKVWFIDTTVGQGPYNITTHVVSPQALQLLRKAAGCDSYVSNQDTSSDMV